MHLERFKPEHLDLIELQESQEYLRLEFPEQVKMYELGTAYTVFHNGRIIACAGLVDTDLGAHLWSLLAKDAPMLMLTRTIRRAFEVYGMRISASAESVAGCRWLEMLGFEKAEEVDVDGINHFVYVRQP